jgi:LDH2 family malate/lactate/ureidoglycolate dehydrogenase
MRDLPLRDIVLKFQELNVKMIQVFFAKDDTELYIERSFAMDISSVSSQALALKEQLNSTQMGLAAVKQAAAAEQKMAAMLAKNSEAIQAPAQAEPRGFSTYA